MKKFLNGFKEFAMRGNVVDMAVGVIIGGAFKAIVDALVNNIISPLIGIFTGNNFAEKAFMINDVAIEYGAFVSAIINFIIVAFVLYLIINAVNKAKSLKKEEPAPAVPTKKICKYCRSEIDIAATRCPCCTSQLGED